MEKDRGSVNLFVCYALRVSPLEVMFSVPSVCQQDLGKTPGPIFVKLGGSM